jgi:hypothetical protein
METLINELRAGYFEHPLQELASVTIGDTGQYRCNLPGRFSV